ncbi:acyl-CoA dehydrogenase family protein [Terricaulis sp.]|uniref:acyl-CoA dehydrogenase family protein n=1 Tax=Terricaulis sp. TaxID=2768686 RepID=UPI002AC7AA73|nr:acyl-CoA dehydrogenase family protein [Terricaulis sp.]MDZ4693192.1 acyl-CoA dehydrogenase family protein [Terricaulis sp.]
MNFDYTDEQNMLRDSIAKWAAGQYDFDKRRAALASEDAWKTNWATFAELGLLAAPLPEEFGGLGGGAIDISVVTEEFGKALVVEPYVPTVVLGGGALNYAGSAAQKEEHLNAIAAGERIIAFAQAEPKSRWTLHDVSTTAKKDGAGYVLNGHKAVVLGAPQADHLLVSARTAGGQRDAKGISLFLVPKNAHGISTRDYPTMDGSRAAEVYFENVSVGAANLIGDADNALALIERIVDEANAAYNHEAVGCMRMMTSSTQEYAKQRKQFGKAIAEFQVIQHRLVDMFMASEESYSMALRATIKLSESDAERAKAVSAAKVSIGQHGRFVGQAAVQIHGGMGVTDEMRVGHYFKRVTMIDATFGNVDTHLKRYTALGAKAA